MPHLIVYYPRFVAAPPRDPNKIDRNVPGTSSRTNRLASGPGASSGSHSGHPNAASSTADQLDETRTVREHETEGTGSTTPGASGRGDKTPTRPPQDRDSVASGHSGMGHGALAPVIAEDGYFNRLGVLDPVGAVPTEPKLARRGGTEAAAYVGDSTIICIACRVRGSAWIHLQDGLVVRARMARTSVCRS